jgi:hypothetical protein
VYFFICGGITEEMQNLPWYPLVDS